MDYRAVWLVVLTLLVLLLVCYCADASGARGGCSGHKTRLAEAAPLGARETGAGCPWCLSCLLVHAAFALRVTTGCATK